MKHPVITLLCLSSVLCAAPAALDQKPEAVSTYVPVVNHDLAGTSAEVVLLIEINSHGYVTNASIKSSTNAMLDQACLDAIRRWKYVPAKKDGQPVASTFLQPIRFGEYSVYTEPVTSAKPALKSSVDPVIPESLEHVTGQVTVMINLNPEGKITNAVVQSATHDELGAICLGAVQQWKFSPAIKDGKPVSAIVYVPFIINGKPLDEETSKKAVSVDNHELKAIRQSPPDLPERLRMANGEAEVVFTVDPKGYVSSADLKSSTNPELGAYACKAVLGWKFRPIVKDGVAVSVKAAQPFKFGEGSIGIEKVDSLPSVKRAVEPELPEALKGVKGGVKVLFVVGAKGEVISVELRSSTLPELEAPVLAAVRQWTFKPAVKAGVPVESRVMIPILFN